MAAIMEVSEQMRKSFLQFEPAPRRGEPEVTPGRLTQLLPQCNLCIMSQGAWLQIRPRQELCMCIISANLLLDVDAPLWRARAG